jgi:hypothetical protein
MILMSKIQGIIISHMKMVDDHDKRFFFVNNKMSEETSVPNDIDSLKRYYPWLQNVTDENDIIDWEL